MICIADMPLTFMRYFYIGSSLRHWMTSMEWPDDPLYQEMMEWPDDPLYQEMMEWPDDPLYQEMMDSFRDTFGDAVLGTRVVDALPFRTIPTDQDTYTGAQDDIPTEAPLLPLSVYDSILEVLNSSGEECYKSAYSDANQASIPLLNPYGREVSSVTRDRLVFATAEKGLRNSFIVFKDAAYGGCPCAGQISQIYLHSRNRAGITATEAFLQIKPYEQLTDHDTVKDPYRKWDDINTHLCYNTFQEHARFVRMVDVVAHFAAYVYTPEDIGTECVVVRSLDRVSSVRACASIRH